MKAIDRLLLPATLALAAADAYILLLLGAAVARRRPAPAPGPGRSRFILLVPAHDEEGTLPLLLRSLESVRGIERAEIVVIADNCSDGTAQVARAAGAEVLERRDPSNRGKGPALAWALQALESDAKLDRPVVLVDADCVVSPNLLEALEARLLGGAVAAQVDYVVSNPDESPASALRAGAFSLVNTVRPLGRDALGLSCGLLGTGMMLTPELLRRVPWRDFGLAEDLEYGLRLAAAGERVEFVPEANVSSPMPTSDDVSLGQQRRWERGKVAAAGEWAPRLVSAGVRLRDPRRLVAGLETLIPPQSFLMLLHLALGALAVVVRAPRSARVAAFGACAQAAYVIGGLAVARAPRAVWRALPRAPLLVLSKLSLLSRDEDAAGWVRTQR